MAALQCTHKKAAEQLMSSETICERTNLTRLQMKKQSRQCDKTVDELRPSTLYIFVCNFLLISILRERHSSGPHCSLARSRDLNFPVLPPAAAKRRRMLIDF
jgi:hypothetical protein